MDFWIRATLYSFADTGHDFLPTASDYDGMETKELPTTLAKLSDFTVTLF